MWDGLPGRLKLSDEKYFTSVDRISCSHDRCERLGLPRNIPRARDVLGVRGIEETLKHHNGLVAFTELLFATTFDRIPDKRTLFILTDARARIIAIHSSPEVIRAAADKGVCVGASAAEDSLGTNAVSLALHDLEMAVLHGEQHYCHILHEWYCVAIPLIDSNGSPMGCLDISMGRETVLGEKLALANCLARELNSYGVKNPNQRFNLDHSHSDLVTVNRNGTKERLTERQHEVLELFSQGLSYKQIARHMQLQSTKTVQEHMDAVRFGASVRRNTAGFSCPMVCS